MGRKSIQIDQYIDDAKDFAKPVLKHFRSLVHQACPEVEEKMKWSFPHFDYKGMMCSMAAFKEHCAISFWKGNIMDDPDKIFKKKGEEAMGQLGKIASLKDLPSDEVLLKYIYEAVRLNNEGIKPNAGKEKKKREDVEAPEYFLDALRRHPGAMNTFENFSPSCRRDYILWVVDAKIEATRNKRIETSVEWLSEGKKFNWKYESKK